MKTKITLLSIALFLFINGKSLHDSNLSIDIQNNFATTYFITINNQTTYQTQNDITINNLRFGQHQVEITKHIQKRDRRRRDRYGRPLMIKKEVLVYNGFINIPARSDVFAKLQYRDLIITDVITKQPPRRGRRNNRGRYERPRDCKPQHPVILPMNQNQFDMLFRTVENESFDSGKLSVLESVFISNYFSSQQILDLMSLFSFDSGKLKVAKLGYGPTIDKENYFIVNNGFTFSSSKRKLNKFIAQQTF